MTTTHEPARPTRALDADRRRTTPLRRTALAAGVAYLVSFVSIPTLVLYRGVHLPGFVSGPGPDTPVLVGGLLEVLVATSTSSAGPR